MYFLFMMYACDCVCLHFCLLVYFFVQEHVCVYVYACVCVCVHIHNHTLKNTHSGKYQRNEEKKEKSVLKLNKPYTN